MAFSGTALFALAAGTGMAVASLAKPGKGASIVSPAAPPAPQAAKAPDADTVAKGMAGAGQAGGSPGVAQTFLTGPGGIDPSLLNLGKNTLLGGGG